MSPPIVHDPRREWPQVRSARLFQRCAAADHDERLGEGCPADETLRLFLEF
jgi:hypothetical protein